MLELNSKNTKTQQNHLCPKFASQEVVHEKAFEIDSKKKETQSHFSTLYKSAVFTDLPKELVGDRMIPVRLDGLHENLQEKYD